GQSRIVQTSPRSLRRQRFLPDLLSLFDSWKGEVDDKAQPSHECAIERGLHVGGKNGETTERFHSLQQIIDFDICVTIVAVLHLATLAKQSISLVEKENRPTAFGGIEHLAQILFSFTDVFADYGRAVDAVEIQLQIIGDDFRGHRLAGSAFAGKQCTDAEAAVHRL